MKKYNQNQDTNQANQNRTPRPLASLTTALALAAALTSVVALTSVAACAQPGEMETDEAAVYVGTWQVSSGVVAVTCPNGSSTNTYKTKVTFLRDAEGGLVRTEQETICGYRFAMGPYGPYLVPGQTCEDSGFDADGYHYSVTSRPMSWTLVPVSDTAIQESYTLSLTIMYDGMGTNCTANVTNSLQKLGE